MIERTGVISFLIITFGITYVIEGTLILTGFRLTGLPPLYGQLAIVGVMWVPAVATVLTIKFITREGFAISNFRIGALRPYLTSALVVPACFIATYTLTWLLGLGQPDWQLASFHTLLASTGAEASTMPSSKVILPAIFLASLFIGPAINGIFGFGEEFGWRGYLLPKLMPLGKLKAYTIVGVIWGLWHAPLIVVGFNYPGYPVIGHPWHGGYDDSHKYLYKRIDFAESQLDPSRVDSWSVQWSGIWHLAHPIPDFESVDWWVYRSDRGRCVANPRALDSKSWADSYTIFW